MNARYRQISYLFAAISKLAIDWVFEFGKCLSYWFLAILIAIPAAAIAQTPSTALTVYKAPGVPALAQLGGLTVQQNLLELREQIRPFEAKLSKLADSIEKQTASADEIAEYSQLLGQVQPYLKQQNELLKEAGLTGAALPASFLQNPNAPEDELKVVDATLEAGGQPLKDEEKLSPEELNRLLSAQMHAQTHGSAVGGAVKSFGVQYLNYSVSMGIMALSQLMLADASNPNAYENWEKQTFSLLGAAGFVVFMGTNHGLIKAYKLLKKNKPPGAFVNYLGMAAGMVAQSVFTELYNDKNMWKCVRPYYDSKAKPVAEACETLRKDWMLSGKILQYTPQVVSMITSTVLAQYARRGLEASGIPHRLNSGYMRVVERGFKIIPKSAWVKGLATALPGAVVGVGDFVLFLAIDSYWTEGVVNQGWQNVRENTFDAKAWTDKWGMHTEYFWPKAFQPIQNAFDVEATTPSTAHTYFMDMLRKMQASSWKKPAAPETCVPKDIAAAAKTAKLDDTKDRWFWQNWGAEWSRAKSNEQLSCEVMARPGDLISRYGDVNREWRGVLLSPFSTSENNWVEMITEFMTVYTATSTFAEYMATQKAAMAYKNAPAPDLSREALAKVINTPLASTEDTNADKPDSAQSWFLDGTWIPTPELVDYVVAGAACGPDPVLDPKAAEGVGIGRFFGNVYTFTARKISSPAFVSSPYGSSLRFVPPKLTSNSRAICENAPSLLTSPSAFYGTVNYITGNHLPDLSSKNDVKSPFSGVFTDENGKTYPSLAQYAFDHLNPDMYKQVGISTSYASWWTSHFDKVIVPIWARYDKTYKGFIDQYYMPILFNRTYRDGLLGSCKANDGLMGVATKTDHKASPTDCANPQSNAYRVSNGIFLSYETEARNYLRGMYSLYVSTLTAKDHLATAKAEYMKLANALILSIQVVSPSVLRSEDFDQITQNAEATLKSINDLIATHLTVKTPDNEFRTEVLAKFNEQISKIIVDEQQVKKNVYLLQFGGGSTSGILNGPLVGGAALGGSD